jgi:predicted phosphodiesterase
MRVAVLADIHGNLAAAEAVMDDIQRQSPDFIVAAGDLAMRGSHPAETVDLLADRCDALLMGNTDAYLAGIYLSGAYREPEHWKTELLHWTRDQLGPQRIATLAAMPFSARYSPRRGQDLFVCHANPKNLEESLEPTLDEGTIRRLLQHVDATAMAFGHLHFPYRRRVGKLVIADVASAGIPRDGDLRPAWGLFTWTPRGWRVQIRRVRYAVRKATQALTARKVPGAPLLIHKMIECRYRHHGLLAEAARRHSGLPPYLRPPPGAAKGLPPPTLSPPPGLAPLPGMSTQADEAADDLLEDASLETHAPELTSMSSAGPEDVGPSGDDEALPLANE